LFYTFFEAFVFDAPPTETKEQIVTSLVSNHKKKLSDSVKELTNTQVIKDFYEDSENCIMAIRDLVKPELSKIEEYFVNLNLEDKNKKNCDF